MSTTSDVWDDGGAYEPYVGRWSRLVAVRFVEWLGLPRGSAWLDFGCGTGALTQVILNTADPRLVVGCDRSAGYVEHARRHTADVRAQFVVAELPALPETSGAFDAVVSGLVLNFLPDPLEGLVAMISRARSGGTVAAYVWDYATGMQMMRSFWDAAVALNPAASELDEGVRFPLCKPEPLRQLLEKAGLRDVNVRALDVPTPFCHFDDYWEPFLGGQAPAPGYVRSLTSAAREQLRETIRRRLPTAPDGRISLTARAWAARGAVT